MDEKSCKSCALKKREDCFGKVNQICKDYKYSPAMTEAEKETWPKEMQGAYSSQDQN